MSKKREIQIFTNSSDSETEEINDLNCEEEQVLIHSSNSSSFTNAYISHPSVWTVELLLLGTAACLRHTGEQNLNLY